LIPTGVNIQPELRQHRSASKPLFASAASVEDLETVKPRQTHARASRPSCTPPRTAAFRSRFS